MVDTYAGDNVCGRSCDATVSPTGAREVPPVERFNLCIQNGARRVLAAHELIAGTQKRAEASQKPFDGLGYREPPHLREWPFLVQGVDRGDEFVGP